MNAKKTAKQTPKKSPVKNSAKKPTAAPLDVEGLKTKLKALKPPVAGDNAAAQESIQDLKKAGHIVVNEPQGAATPGEDTPPIFIDPEIQMLQDVLKQIDKFQGERHQNTHITEDQRLVIGAIYTNLAKDRFSVSREICKKMGIPFDEKEFYVPCVINFLKDYIDFGVPVDNKGRIGTENVLSAFVQGIKDKLQAKKEDEKMLS